MGALGCRGQRWQWQMVYMAHESGRRAPRAELCLGPQGGEYTGTVCGGFSIQSQRQYGPRIITNIIISNGRLAVIAFSISITHS